jgi:CRP/FNR family transcriptional regulator
MFAARNGQASAADSNPAAPERCLQCEVRGVAICASMGDALLARLSSLGRTRKLKRGDTLTWEGDDATLVANVRSGILRLTCGTSDGEQQILGLAFAGDFVGQFHEEHERHSVTALTDTTVCLFRRAEFSALASETPQLAGALLTAMSAELGRSRQWMRILGRKSAEERVATFLWDLYRRSGAAENSPVPLPLSRQQIADILGLTIETVSRKIRQISRSGLIELPDLRSFCVRSAHALERLAA